MFGRPLDTADRAPIAVVQVKCAAVRDGWGDDGTDQIPVHYRAQVIWEMDVVGVGVAYLPVPFAGQHYREYVVEFDAADAAFMRERAEWFVDRLLRREPTPGRRRRRSLGRTDAYLLVLVVITLLSTIATWSLNNRIERNSDCMVRVTTQVVSAVNECTTYTGESAQRAEELWRAQLRLLSIPPDTPPEDVRAAVREYSDAVDEYLRVQERAQTQRRENPYPTVDEIERCRDD